MDFFLIVLQNLSEKLFLTRTLEFLVITKNLKAVE